MVRLLTFLVAFTSFTSFGSHIVGGEIYYDSLGNDQYRVTLEIYRDCSGSNFDNPIWYTVFNANGTIFAEFSVPLPQPDTLPIVYDDPCVTPPNDICIERAIYIDTITLPATPGGYYISYQRCCWASNILNVVNPGSWGITLTCDVPGTNLVGTSDNNSARYVNYPPIVLCSNNTLTFDHSATDIDGDSLVYSLCTPKTIDAANVNPNPEFAAPYADLTWEAGFSGTQPFGPGSNVTIDPQTGLMNITPNQIGTFVAGVCLEEYRNGVLINSKIRVFGYRVVVCDVIEPIVVTAVGGGTMIEDCNAAGFIISRDDTSSALTFEVLLTGTAINGTDYNFIPNTITIPAGVASDTIAITPYADGILEGNETIILSVIVPNPCENTFDTTTASLTIIDYTNMSITHEDSINVCDDFGEVGMLWCNIQNGYGPYSYYWEPTPYANNDTIVFAASDLNPNLNLMMVSVTDACGKGISSTPIIVMNQCPIQPPNVITANGDGINDAFVIRNTEDYERVHLQIFNRWGNLVYESEDYQNDWTGLDMKKRQLEEGVYTYVAMPTSIKFEYDDEEKALYTAHGFVHIVR